MNLAGAGNRGSYTNFEFARTIIERETQTNVRKEYETLAILEGRWKSRTTRTMVHFTNHGRKLGAIAESALAPNERTCAGTGVANSDRENKKGNKSKSGQAPRLWWAVALGEAPSHERLTAVLFGGTESPEGAQLKGNHSGLLVLSCSGTGEPTGKPTARIRQLTLDKDEGAPESSSAPFVR